MEVLLENWAAFAEGFGRTILLVVLCGTFALILGVVAGAMRVAPLGALRSLSTVYVTIFRNSPSVVLLFVAVFVLPEVGLTLSFLESAVIAISLYYGAFVCEAVRSGIASVPVGQLEAARSIGLTFSSTLRRVVLPQALRTTVPALVNLEISVVRTSAIAGAFGVMELFATMNLVGSANESAILWILGLTAGLYLTITLTLGSLAGVLERRVAFKR